MTPAVRDVQQHAFQESSAINLLTQPGDFGRKHSQACQINANKDSAGPPKARAAHTGRSQPAPYSHVKHQRRADASFVSMHVEHSDDSKLCVYPITFSRAPADAHCCGAACAWAYASSSTAGTEVSLIQLQPIALPASTCPAGDVTFAVICATAPSPVLGADAGAGAGNLATGTAKELLSELLF